MAPHNHSQVYLSPTPRQEQVGQIINTKTKKVDSFFKTIMNFCGQLLYLQCFQAQTGPSG